MIKGEIKKRLAEAYYHRYLHKMEQNGPLVHVMTAEETIAALQGSDKSLVRFGDGEVTLLRNRNNATQQPNEELIHRLQKIMPYPYDGLMVTMPDIFQGLDRFVPSSQAFWEDHFFFCHQYYEQYCSRDRVYGNTNFSRPYITMKDHSHCANHFASIRQIWKGSRVIVVEGVTSHNGVGNDLLCEAAEVRRILIPPRNAYGAYDKILEECQKITTDWLFLLSCGAAAKPLAEDLFRNGYRVIDIGNLDTEYEWYRMGAEQKCPIPKQQITTREGNVQAGYTEYLKQIVARIE